MYFYLGTILQFRLSPSLHGHETTLFTNHPITHSTASSSEESFSRQNYHKVVWDVDKENEETFADLKTLVSGCFQFYFEKDGYLL